MLAALTSNAAVVLQWLLDRLDNDPTLADCELRSRAQALSLSTGTESETSRIRSLGRAGSELAELVAGVVTDCICAAFDPPCAPCDDTDVLLACLEVSDCTVVRICNAERDYVISGSALRYWLPTGPLHEWLEIFCCRPDRCRDAARAEPGTLAFSEAGFGAGESVSATPWNLLGLPDPAHFLRDVMERAGAARAAPAVPPSPAAGRADADAAAQQLAALAKRVDDLIDQLTQTQARLDTAEASLSTLGDQPQAVPASPSQPRRRQRASAGRRPAEAPAPADAAAAKADVAEAVEAPDAPETSDDT